MNILVSIFTFLLFVCMGAGLYLGDVAGAWLGVLAAIVLTALVVAGAWLLAAWHDWKRAAK